MNVYYLCCYADVENKQNRNVFLSAVNKVNYIIDCIIKAGHKVTVVSFADSADAYNKKGEFKQLKDGLFLKTFFSLGNKNVFVRVVGRNLLKLEYLLYLFKTVKPGDTLVVYHSPFYFRFLKAFKKILRCNLVLEVEEIYSDVSIKYKYRKSEISACAGADAYIFPTSMLNDIVNLNNKPFVTIHGIYQPAEVCSKPEDDGCVHCVYSGIFDPRKGCITAIQAAKYLPENYCIHVLGFGTDEDTKALKAEIERLKQCCKCKVSFDGCLTGKEYSAFIQKCHIGLSPQDPNAVFNTTSFPSKILAYLSNGLKVVSIDIPAIRESDISECICFYSEQTPQKIADAIKCAEVSKIDAKEVLTALDIKFARQLNKLFKDL